jgi:hypothetical protein
MTDSDVTRVNAIFEPEITDVNVAGFGAGRGAAVGGEVNRTLIVLFKDVTGDGIALSFHEVFNPDSMGKVIASTDCFSFGGAFSTSKGVTLSAR